ncbi:cytochrome ubiquinol oxidase subunit I [Desulfoluna butyratoxydans]|uniref:Cytochrome ubiquinol oxidase subunit 1 n=1 Tax=Desulfoluna butyratoxydans TaxID=231438 RepID=A0A4U8YNH6_9BACT|nr:cytochrome ubiquinol oxidase subunit I [Desulfoluna butyratoxydans]VFQ44769.1 cytochrome ubiquinol oxidase subunit 1 [Desulfoluna butyratoxydans]
MSYPVLDFFAGGGGLLIAVIAVTHVYVAHFAVGGGLFLVLTEARARKRESAPLLAYVKGHTKFFLLLTMVFGGLSGVAIWFTIGILSPDATGKLIEVFLFAWAAEWVFFSVEITALLIYWYRFDSLSPTDHLRVGWIYFGAAWLSLFIINGVISFMLTPGAWAATGRFTDAFFNPSFWPSTLFRTFLAIWAAGLFGFVTAAFSKDEEVREEVLGFYTLWVVGMGLAVLGSGRLYLAWVPEAHLQGRYEFAAAVPGLISGFSGLTLIIMALAACMWLLKHRGLRKPLALGVLALGLLHMGLFEMVREHARKPWIIPGVLYANNLSPQHAGELNQSGLRSRSPWLAGDQLTGRNLFKAQCLSCHSVGGPINDIRPLTERYTPQGLGQALAGQGVLHTYMPPFFGDARERQLLADWLTQGLHGPHTEAATPQGASTVSSPLPEPRTRKEPVLLAWRRTQGNGRLQSPLFVSAKPVPQRIQAAMVMPGDFPEVVLDGAELSVTSGGDAYPMAFDDDLGTWVAEAGQGRFNDSCLVTATADGQELNTVLLPPEPDAPRGCYHCHGGSPDPAGIGEETAAQILAAHDKNSGTSLATRAAKGMSITCRSCHSGNRPSPSAALHGWHNPYMADKGEASCRFCHDSGPEYVPAFFSGRHREPLDCTRCHGTLTVHTARLLKDQRAAEAVPLKAPLQATLETVSPRQAHAQLPDCLSCHQDFEPPSEGATASMTSSPDERFSAMKDEMEALSCAACHSRAHELLPASRKGTNNQAIAYMGEPGVIGRITCTVCHAEEPEDEGHHPGMLKNR